MNRNIQILKLPSKTEGRTVCISDIHGNLNVYLKLLKECRYDPKADRLILLGDMIEKGPENLATLQTIIKQKEQGEVYCLMGNCDFTVRNAFLSYRLDFLKEILHLRKHSILHEMAETIGFHFDENTDMEKACQLLRKHFFKEMAFIADLPHVIETPDTVFVHAGIQSENDYGPDFRIAMTTSFFAETDQCFSKRVVCGHMPVTEYCKYIADFDPVFDAKRNIYSIDGGNIVKKAGQLNALVFEGTHASVYRTDNLPQATVLHDVEYRRQIPLFCTWNRGQIEILKQEQKQSYVRSPYLNRSFWMENEFIEYRNQTYYATDYTNYEIPLQKGEIVQVAAEYQDKVQIKKNGILGWTYRKNLNI